jgi:hypothetical protein
MPLLPPVTRAVFPVKRIILLLCITPRDRAESGAGWRRENLSCGAGKQPHSNRHERRQHQKFCMLIIMHKFSIMLVMQIVKRYGAKNGLFAGTKG